MIIWIVFLNLRISSKFVLQQWLQSTGCVETMEMLYFCNWKAGRLSKAFEYVTMYVKWVSHFKWHQLWWVKVVRLNTECSISSFLYFMVVMTSLSQSNEYKIKHQLTGCLILLVRNSTFLYFYINCPQYLFCLIFMFE